MTFPYQKICASVVGDLDPRARDILEQRFGLGEGEPKTLEAIGQTYDITRERVRQIVEGGLSQVRANMRQGEEQQKLQEIFQYFSGILKDAGYLQRQDLFLVATNSARASNHVLFLLRLGDQFQAQRETEYFHPFWANKKEVLERIPLVIEEVLNYFEQHNEPRPFDDVAKDFAHFFQGSKDFKASPQTLLSMLEISKHIERGYNGRWGLKKWPEVYPRGVRDKAYLVLKDTKEPLHFVRVAQLIEQLQEQGILPGEKSKKILPQTVHNELIKDSKFVLVGRGTYALSEWGYTPGTVKDIIVHILTENGNSMARQEIIQKTLEQRQVKESTILLNLQDRNYFLRDPEGRYYLTST